MMHCSELSRTENTPSHSISELKLFIPFMIDTKLVLPHLVLISTTLCSSNYDTLLLIIIHFQFFFLSRLMKLFCCRSSSIHINYYWITSLHQRVMRNICAVKHKIKCFWKINNWLLWWKDEISIIFYRRKLKTTLWSLPLMSALEFLLDYF